MFNFIYKTYRKRFYDKLVLELLQDIPEGIKEPALEWLADRKILLEKFLLLQAYRIQKSWTYSDKSQDFRDGALLVIKAFLTAVNQKVIQRTTIVPVVDETAKVADEKKGVDDFLKGFKDK